MKSLVLLILIGFAATTANGPPSEGWAAGDSRMLESISIELRYCPPTEYSMGFNYGPNPSEFLTADDIAVKVKVSRGFWIGRTEVTQSQWKAVMSTEPWLKDWPTGPDYPASGMTRAQAIEFCKRLTERERAKKSIKPSEELTLPTEAQWELACRAGSSGEFCFGQPNFEVLKEHAWFLGNAPAKSHPQKVGTKKPNNWGIFDMHGNVQEICLDDFVSKLPGGMDPLVDNADDLVVARGGTFYYAEDSVRSSARSCHDSETPKNGIDWKDSRGFRIVLNSP